MTIANMNNLIDNREDVLIEVVTFTGRTELYLVDRVEIDYSRLANIEVHSIGSKTIGYNSYTTIIIVSTPNTDNYEELLDDMCDVDSHMIERM